MHRSHPSPTLIILLIALMFALTGCADWVSLDEAQFLEPVGFLHGLWHGFIIPVSFLVSIFDGDVAIYAIYNSGRWYDFGFFLGVFWMMRIF